VLGTLGGLFILIVGLAYLEWNRRKALAAQEGYGTDLINEPAPFENEQLAHPVIAILPLVLVGVMNKVFTMVIPSLYGDSVSFAPAVIGKVAPVVQQTKAIMAIWAVEGALLVGIATVSSLPAASSSRSSPKARRTPSPALFWRR